MDAENEARDFWRRFSSSDSTPKFVFGRNVYADALSEKVNIDGFVDDFTDETTYNDKPIVASSNLPQNALVVIASGGRPLTVRKRLRELGLAYSDYFVLQKVCDEDLPELVFNEGFAAAFDDNRSKFEAIYEKLADDESKRIFKKIVSFRYFQALFLLDGFTERQSEQYFEDFLQLKHSDEVFFDVGCFDGATSLEFVSNCPDYKSIVAFEPDPVNARKCASNLSHLRDVEILKVGAGSEKCSLRFDIGGSTSSVSESGKLMIEVDLIDHVTDQAPTLIKMDVEGFESGALKGAENKIRSHKPRIAVSAYHKANDLWQLPEMISNIHDDYDIFLRHYTESIYETVLFFVPRSLS